MDDDAQFVIPDLDDDSLFPDIEIAPPRLLYGMSNGSSSTEPWAASTTATLPPAPHSPLDEGSGPSGTKSRAGRLRHIRSGSLNADESASITTKSSSMRFGSSFSSATLPGTDYHPSPSRAVSGHALSSSFSFPVKKKSSFASLRAAIKGQPSLPSSTQFHAPQPTTPSARDGLEATSPFFAEFEAGASSKKITRTLTLSDITAMSSGLAHATGMTRAARRHDKSASQASLPPHDTSSSSPLRTHRSRHAHKGSHLSEYSLDGAPVSPSSVSVAPTADGLSSPVALRAPDDVESWMLQGDISFASTRPDTYAAQHVLYRFTSIADDALYTVLSAQQDHDVLTSLFPTAAHRVAWDDLLESMASVAQYDRSTLQNALLEWRTDALDAPSSSRLGRRRTSDPNILATPGVSGEMLRRRCALTATYLACSALLPTIPPGTNDKMGLHEEDLHEWDEFLGVMFQCLHLCSVERESERGSFARLHTTLQQHCFDIVARVLGALSRHCLPALGEQFIAILRQANAVAVSRDNELLTEAAILGMRYLRITVYPMEAFEAGATFLTTLAQFFSHAHGYRIKRAFARVLHTIIEPVARYASAELLHPVWVSAMHTMLPKAQGMLHRSRYWAVAYPLCAVIVCASPPGIILEKWYSLVEMGMTRHKERKDTEVRASMLPVAAQLLWAYLFRCHEGTNPTKRRLDAFFALCLPSPRSSLQPSDACVDACVDMLSHALFRQFEYTRPLVLEMLRHKQLDDKAAVHQPNLLQPTRMCIAIRAITQTLACYVQGEAPLLPGGEVLSPDALATEPSDFAYPNAEVGETQAYFHTLIARITLVCDYILKDVTLMDERTPVARGSLAPVIHGERASLDLEHYQVRTHAHTHGTFTVAYLRDHQPALDLLRTCIQTWPRCLSTQVSMATCHALLFRALYSVDPLVRQASAATVRRWAQAQSGAYPILTAFVQWSFRHDGLVWELHPHADLLLGAIAQAADLMVELMALWCEQPEPAPEGEHLTLESIEAGALMLLCIPSATLRQHGLSLLRYAQTMAERLQQPCVYAAMRLDTPCTQYLHTDHSCLSLSERARISKWQDSGEACTLARLACTAEYASLWMHALPLFLADVVQQAPGTAARLSNMLHGAAHRLEPTVAAIAQVRRSSAPAPNVTPLIRTAWRSYTTALCTVASTDPPPPPIGMLIPYLACADREWQDDATDALSHIHAHAYPALVHALMDALDDTMTSQRVATGLILAQTSHYLPCPDVHEALVAYLQRTLPLLQADAQPSMELFQLRRCFCVLLAHVYPALDTTLAEQAFPIAKRHHLLSLLHEWHSLQDASRLAAQLSAAMERSSLSNNMPKDKLLVSLRQELHWLATRAEQAMAVLCAAPMDTSPSVHVPTILAWLCEMLIAPLASSRDAGRRALHALLEHNARHEPLLQALVSQCYRDLGQAKASRTAFMVLVPMYTRDNAPVSLPLREAVCLSLAMLAHSDVEVRAGALGMLEVTLQRHHDDDQLSLARFAPAVRSMQLTTYLDAQVHLSHTVELRDDAMTPALCSKMLEEWARQMEHAPPSVHASILSLLPPWIPALDDPEVVLPTLSTLLLLSLMYATVHPQAVHALWQPIGHAVSALPHVIAFLHRRALHYRSVEFFDVARLVLGCLPPPAVPTVHRLLLSHLTDDGLVPWAPEHELMLPMDAHLPPPGTELPALPPVLVSLVLLGECVTASLVQHASSLVQLLQALCLYMDNTPALLQSHVVRAMEQILSVLVPHARADGAVWDAFYAVIRGSRDVWARKNDVHVPPVWQQWIDVLVSLAETQTRSSSFRSTWRDNASHVATHTSVLRLACRSLQIVRALRPTYTPSMLPMLLARLQETVASRDSMAYTLEALATMQAMAAEADADTLVALYWSALACTDTPQEPVFVASLSFWSVWLERVSTLDTDVQLATSQPATWATDTPSLQLSLLRGLRSARMDEATLPLLLRWAEMPLSAHVESTAEDRALVLLTVALPWCMETCESASSPHVDAAWITRLGDALAYWAQQAHRPDLERIATSLARSRFRRADDLARQAASCLMQGASAPQATYLSTMLLLLLHNQREWVAKHTLAVLPLLWQALPALQIHAFTSPVPLDALYRWAKSPIASLALSVLHQPMLSDADLVSNAPSTWAGTEVSLHAGRTAANMKAVSQAWTPPAQLTSTVSFVSDAHASVPPPSTAELGCLASQLDDLALFFAQDSSRDTPSPKPSHDHVAKILARSTYQRRESIMPWSEPDTTTMSDMSYNTTAGDASRFFGKMYEGVPAPATRGSDPFVLDVTAVTSVPATPGGSGGSTTSPLPPVPALPATTASPVVVPVSRPLHTQTSESSLDDHTTSPPSHHPP
ncbi:tao3-transcriptional activator of och1 [Malassezia pachydermatis]|uniref:Tao3-transcriptional activator of och1 n=1 Tax=Malassezia pachydermatis TaxID=77020 RepID=A0A0M8MVE4_9BASI|nr:tao3-transcriptional activator of och1 [Malassezia pachydermatis]KOS15114.1 tao3-transcriptional activator of och1 [Malassezia pachydermatis]